MEKFVLFKAGREHCGIPMTMVNTIESAGALLPGGKTSGDRQDIAFRGHSVPLVDMTRLLAPQRNGMHPEERKILLLNGQTMPMALLLDKLHAVAEVDARNVLQMPPEVEEPALSYFPQVLRHPEGLVFLLNPENILGRKTTLAADGADGPSVKTAHNDFPPSGTAPPGESLQSSGRPGRRPGRALVSALRGQTLNNRHLMVLFSLLQIEEILRSLQVHPVPFTPGYTEGIVDWRGRLLPLISLESRLGFTAGEPSKTPCSYVVVRMAASGRAQTGALYGILKVGRSIRELKLPIDCRPVSENPTGIDPLLIRGLYEWEDNLLLVPHMGRILHRR